MVDVVGIIAAGKLVREGPMSDLLSSEGVVRVRVRPADTARAAAALAPLLPPESGGPTPYEEGWLSVHLPPSRSEEVSKTLAQAGIYPAELLLGSDLEQLFLKLTQDSVHVDPDGSFARIGTIDDGTGAVS
jgi:ABC-type multidrug transport system ATPase subunit